jgi:hypothetical protein
LLAVARREARLDKIHAKLRAEIVAEMRREGARALRDPSAVERLLRARFERHLAARVRELEGAVLEGTMYGIEAAASTSEALRLRVHMTAGVDAMQLAGRRIAGDVTVDRLSLSMRVRVNDARAVEGMRQQIAASARAQETTIELAERLLDQDRYGVKLPEYVEALVEAAGDGEIESAVRAWRGRMSALGEVDGAAGTLHGNYTVRSATQRLVRDLRRAGPDDIAGAVDRWVLERARHQARVIARNETVEAFRDGYKASTRNEPHVHGYRWALSGRHPKADPCDLLANQDLYGLGPGGYPADELPSTPHPSCLCTQSAIVDDQHFRRELARARGEAEPPRPWESDTHETAAEWLGRQPAAYRQRMLGPTRAEMFTREPHRVLGARGELRPVHEVMGRPPPGRGVRTARDLAADAKRTRRVVLEDRARMVQPRPATARAR